MGKIENIGSLTCLALVLCFRAAQADGTNGYGSDYALTALGADEMHSGKFDKAIIDFSKAVEIRPTNGYAYLNRAIAYSANGDYEKAVADFDKSISINSSNSFAFIGRADVYAKLGKYEKAVADFDKGIDLNAGNMFAFASRGFCHEKLGKYAKAENDYSKAVEMDSNFAEAWNSLAWLRATCPSAEVRNGKEAVGEAARACDLANWKNWMYLDTLAVAYAEAGDFESAIKNENNALQLVDPQNKEISRMKNRLLLFQQKQPYRDDPTR